MYQELKSEICNIIEIVNQCPETLREKCFELLLTNFLNSRAIPYLGQGKPADPHTDSANIDGKERNHLGLGTGDEEITKKDFHMKIQRFLETSGIGYDVINKLYYKENGSILPLYETLNSTQMSECQIRLSVLTAFENSFTSGDMALDGEVIRKRCQDMKCYDAANFAANYKKYSNLFDNWNDKYERTTLYSLSSEGKKKLAEVLLEVSKDI